LDDDQKEMNKTCRLITGGDLSEGGGSEAWESPPLKKEKRGSGCGNSYTEENQLREGLGAEEQAEKELRQALRGISETWFCLRGVFLQSL